MTKIGVLTRREFVGTSAQAATAGLLAQTLQPAKLLGKSAWDADGYQHKSVVRVYDPEVASAYSFGDAYYWRKFDQARLVNMLNQGVMDLSATKRPHDAWARILPGLSPASKIVVKVNLNNTRREWKAAALNTSPAMMVALTKSLNLAGVRNDGIVFLDCSRPFPEEMKSDVLAECPGVHCVGGEQTGSSVSLEMPYGGPYIFPQLAMDADFLISCHLMKKHDGGHTGAIKNFFGMKSDGRVTFAHGKPGWMEGDQCRRIITHPEMRKRLKLCIDEAIVAANSPDTLDPYQFSALFPNGRPSSLFLSRNPFLQDVVGWDFVRTECAHFPCRAGNNISWLKNCAGALPAWSADAVESGVLVDGGEGMPPKDMSYNQNLVHYSSRRAGHRSNRNA